MKKQKIVMATGALALTVSMIGLQPANANEDVSAYDEEAIWAELTAFIDENPGDFAGLEALTMDLYGEGLAVAVEGVDGNLTGAEAQVVLDQQAEIPLSDSADIGIQSVPVDAFSVAFSFIPLPGDNQAWWAAYGTWNFRDDYVNGSAPDDFASNRIQINTPFCMEIGQSHVETYTYDGQHTNKGYLHDAGLGTDAPIVGLRDTVSGFMLGVDHGYVLTALTGLGCGPIDVRGMFTYEHNQDGGSVLSVNASFGGFGVSYAGVSSTLQKSSGIVSIN